MSVAIKVENLSKAYQLGEIGTGTISRDLERWVAKVRGKEDPYLKIGEENDRATKGTSDIVWSLKDINFEIQQGDAVGIIGRNGAGKSTLLKILSRVTSPTAGKITGKGRIASLLEVGTGFHPELSGRENIYLNGAILGMRKKEITRKLDQIIEFSGVERYVDTPVKRYSSGMYVRLAFAVAAHLESEILVVDEVLAVGDVEFQNKCLGKMKDVSKGEGRTVLFVSHNLTAVKNLCTKGIMLSNGRLTNEGSVNAVIEAYKVATETKTAFKYSDGKSTTDLTGISKASIETRGNQPHITLNVSLEINILKENANCILVIDIINSDSVCVFQSIKGLKEHLLFHNNNPQKILAEINLFGIVIDTYTVNVYLCTELFANIDSVSEKLFFEIIDSPVKEKLSFDYKGTSNGYIYPITKISNQIK